MTYQEILATEKQHKFWVYLCKGLKGMTAPEMGRLEEKFMKKWKIERWSDVNQNQISHAIDYINIYYEKGKKVSEQVNNLYFGE